MNQQSQIGNLVNSKIYPLLLFLISFVFVVLFSRSTSFLYVFEGGDPSVFKQMGRAVLKGKILYIDYFDNKGCLLYFIHALGLWLGGNFALLFMQACTLTVTLSIWDKMLALYHNQRQRMICLGIALFMLFCFYGAGDQTQEWCLPFISYPLLVYLRAYKTNTEIRPLQHLLVGLCFGIITFIQINNTCAFLGFVAYLWFCYLLKKDIRKLFASLGYFFIGWLIVAIPCVLYFYLKAGWHGVYEMVYASFLSNFEYMGHQWKTRWFFVIPYSLFIVSLAVWLCINYRKNKEIIVPSLISIFLFATTFGRLCNPFYLAALLPLCIIALTSIDFSEKRNAKIGISAMLFVSLAFYAGNNMKDLIFQNKKQSAIYKQFHQCIENIPETERDSIYNYNLYWNGTSMMEHEKLLPCNRVLFTALVFTLPKLWKEETEKPLIPPKWMLVSFDKSYKANDAYFIIENYELAHSFVYDYELLQKPKIGESFQVCLYRRKALSGQ